MNFRIYFLKLAARHPAWRFFISLIHSSIIIFLFFILYALNILQVEIAAGSVFLVPPIIILTYTFFLRRFANPTKLEELLKLKEEKDKEREIERAREKERIDSDRRWREEGERESKERERKKRERERKKRERERKEEEKRIKDNYLDIGLGHKLPKTIEKIRNPITDKRVITVQGNEDVYDVNSKTSFCNRYTVKYMPTLLHEIRKELIYELIDNEPKYTFWKRWIRKVYDPLLAKKEVQEDFLNSSIWDFGGVKGELLENIIVEKLIEYFQENGWTLSENQFKKEVRGPHIVGGTEIVNKYVFYLHPPEK